MNEMIERVSLALFAESEAITPTPEHWPESTSDTLKRFWGCYAKAAIQAMKEPTAVMVNAGEAFDPGDTPGEWPRPEDSYRRMVYEALK